MSEKTSILLSDVTSAPEIGIFLLFSAQEARTIVNIITNNFFINNIFIFYTKY